MQQPDSNVHYAFNVSDLCDSDDETLQNPDISSASSVAPALPSSPSFTGMYAFSSEKDHFHDAFSPAYFGLQDEEEEKEVYYDAAEEFSAADSDTADNDDDIDELLERTADELFTSLQHNVHHAHTFDNIEPDSAEPNLTCWQETTERLRRTTAQGMIQPNPAPKALPDHISEAERDLIFNKPQILAKRVVRPEEAEKLLSPAYNKLREEDQTPRRSPLMILTAIFCGILIYILFDSGCSMRSIIDIEVMKRAGLREIPPPPGMQAPTITIGDGSKVQASYCQRGLLEVCHFQTHETPVCMPLSKDFGMVLGKPYNEYLETLCEPLQPGGDTYLACNFTKNTISFTLREPQRGRKHFTFSTEASVTPQVVMTPESTQSFSHISHVDFRENSKNALMVMVDSQGSILETHGGDNFLPCDNIFHSSMAPRPPPEPDPDVGMECDATSTSSPPPPCTPWHSPTTPSPPPPPEPPDDQLTDRELIDKALKQADPRNFEPPKPDPNWQPQLPTPSDDFSDIDFQSRVQPKHNTADKLANIEEHYKVNLVSTKQGVLKLNGQIYKDDVPAYLVPDRGEWNAQLKFSDPAEKKDTVNLKSNRLSPDQTRACAGILRDMLLRGTIRPSNSPWGTPVFLVPKADGGWRLCCDYRLLNAKLVHESYSIPAADQLFDLMRAAKIFSTHDCTWGYHQLRWSQESIPYTAIKTHLGTFEFLVMNFGPTSSPAQWQRLVEAVLRPVLGDICVIYLDDLCVFSKTPEDHVKHLNIVYRLLAKNHIYLRFGKCYYFQTAFKFLGWIIRDGTIGVDPDKISALTTWPCPNSKREVRSFTGFCNFYRRLIPNFTKIMAPLYDLQRDSVPDNTHDFEAGGYWTPECSQAFEAAKLALTTAPVVHLVHPDRAFFLFPDASNVGIGGVLEQAHPDLKRVVIAYLSKRLNSAHARYEAGKLELLSLIVCLQHWRHYLQGCHGGFTIYTDHEPLLAIKKTKNPSRMLLRWLYFIEQFNFKVMHKKGTEQPADMLSRPRPDPNDPGISVTDDDNTDDISPDLSTLASMETATQSIPGFHDTPSAVVIDRIRTHTRRDAMHKAILDNPSKFRTKFRVKNDLIFNLRLPNSPVFVPKSLKVLREAFFDAAHNHPTSGHFGHLRTLLKMQRSVWWPGMSADVKRWVQQCNICITTKRLSIAAYRPHPHDVPQGCWVVMFMDGVSGIPTSNGCDTIWIFVDKLSKMAHFVPITNKGFTSADFALIFLRNVFRLHGMPQKIVSDRDDLITADFWQTLVKYVGTAGQLTTTDHPRTDSAGEATVKACVALCRRFVNSNQDNWFDLLPALEFAYNDTPTVTGFSPFEINIMRHPRSTQTVLSEEILKEIPGHKPHQGSIRMLRQYGKVIRETRAALIKQAIQQSQPAPVTQKRYRQEVFKLNQAVLLHRSKAGRSFPQNKMAPIWVGPFLISSVISDIVYRLALPTSMQVNPVVNIEFLRAAPEGARPVIHHGPHDEPLARLTERPLVIIDHSILVDEHEITDLFVTTSVGYYTVHETCQRGHFQEIIDYFSDSHNYWRRPLPYHLGRRGVFTFARGDKLTGIITAYDPNDIDNQYQLDFSMVEESLWTRTSRIKLKAKPPRPIAANTFTALSSTTSIPRPLHLRQLRVLELFSGPNASFSTAVRQQYPDAFVITIEIMEKNRPDIVADLSDWRALLSMLPGPKFFNIIFMSPPCTFYSPARTTTPSSAAELHQSDHLVTAGLHVIKALKPAVWFLENPHTKLWQRDIVRHIDSLRHLCSYCMYGTDYRKATDIWSNIPLNLKTCRPNDRCICMVKYGRHLRSAQAGPTRDGRSGITAREANNIPEKLCLTLLSAAIVFLRNKNPKRG